MDLYVPGKRGMSSLEIVRYRSHIEGLHARIERWTGTDTLESRWRSVRT
jgi:hypothetical protein